MKRGPTKIEADVFGRNGDVPRPAIVWIHGGALIMGNRDGVPQNIVALARMNNYVLISIDYRLAPEVRLPAIIEDLQDALRSIHTQATGKAAPRPTKDRRLGRIGGRIPDDDDRHLRRAAAQGAGGLLGIRRHRRPLVHRTVDPLPTATAGQQGRGPPMSAAMRKPAPTAGRAARIISICGKTACGPTGSERLPILKPRCRVRSSFCPAQTLPQGTRPRLVTHGTADTDVPYQESADMDAALKKQGVEHELITVEGGGHGLGDKTNPAVIDAHARRSRVHGASILNS